MLAYVPADKPKKCEHFVTELQNRSLIQGMLQLVHDSPCQPAHQLHIIGPPELIVRREPNKNAQLT